MIRHRAIIGWTAVLIGSAAAMAVPFIFSFVMFGEFLPPILIQVETDTVYYLTHVQKVLQGHPMLGNPYFLEYRDMPYPGLRLPVMLSAIPGFLGVSINAVYAINAFLYGMLTGAALYVLCLHVSDRRRWLSAAVAVLGVASLSNLILRPAIMQTVYPVFGLFMIALLLVLEKPHAAKRYVLLGIASALAFYMYPHLWMQNFTSLGLLYLLTMWKRDWKTLRYLSVTAAAVLLVCLPQILETVALFHDPAAMIINKRVGLVETHAVLPLTILNNKYTILVIVGLLALRLRRTLSITEMLLLLLASAVVIAAVSNIVTGKLMDFHSHPWRLGLMVNIAGIAILLESFRKHRDLWSRAVVGFCAAALLFTTINRTFIRMNSYSYIPRRAAIVERYARERDYERVFAFLESRDIHDRVILADPHIGFMVPLYSDNGILYVARSVLHIVPNDELLERFLTFFVDDIDAEFLAETVSDYEGLTHKETIIYKNAYPDPSLSGIVRAFLYGLLGKDLPGTWAQATMIDEIGGQDFIAAALKRHAEIRRNYEEYLHKYHVEYVIVDRNAEWKPRVPNVAKEIYRDDRFTIYAL